MYFWFEPPPRGLRGGMGKVAECDVVVGCILFGMHFSQSKNALLLNFRLFHMTQTNCKLLKRRWCAWDSNQYGRRRQIHWAMAAPKAQLYLGNIILQVKVCPTESLAPLRETKLKNKYMGWTLTYYSRAVVVDKWSACLPSTPTTRVRIQLKPTVFYAQLKPKINKMRAGLAHL